MYLRRRLVLAPLPLRAAARTAGVAAALVVMGALNSFDGLWVTVTVVGVVLMAGWATVGEGWERRLLAREIGWQGDPVELALVAADVDSGRIPTADARTRELGRRYAAARAHRLRWHPAVSVGVAGVATVNLVRAVVSGQEWGPSVFLVLVAGLLLHQGWVLRPRCTRAAAVLTESEHRWAQRV